MLLCHPLEALFHLNTLSPTPKCYLLLQPRPSLISVNLFSTTSDSDQQSSFTVSYFTNNCGLSPQAALKASKRVRFDTPHKPDSVITFFTNHGFSNSQINSIIVRAPELFVSDPIKTILPKFEFLASKGASASDIVTTVSRSPRFLRGSLEKHIIPAFDLVSSFCPSDEKAIASIIACPTSISDARMKPNVQYLLDDVGVTPSSIYHLLRTRPSVICSTDLRTAVEEIKELGFDPSKFDFGVALLTKRAVTKSQWDAKVDAFKSWGFSEDAIFHAFRKHPNLMLRSVDKLNAVMSFWISKLGWDPSALIATPVIFGYSMKRRLIPRALVVQYLLTKGLIKKDASLYRPFSLSDELFLQKYVERFQEENSRLLRLYQGEGESDVPMDHPTTTRPKRVTSKPAYLDDYV